MSRRKDILERLDKTGMWWKHKGTCGRHLRGDQSQRCFHWGLLNIPGKNPFYRWIGWLGNEEEREGGEARHAQCTSEMFCPYFLHLKDFCLTRESFEMTHILIFFPTRVCHLSWNKSIRTSMSTELLQSWKALLVRWAESEEENVSGHGTSSPCGLFHLPPPSLLYPLLNSFSLYCFLPPSSISCPVFA